MIKYFITNGPFAVLFLWLLFNTRKEIKAREEQLREDNRKREEKYQTTIDKNQSVIQEFATKLDVVEDIKLPMATGFNNVVAHQCTERGRVPGINGNVYLNNFDEGI